MKLKEYIENLKEFAEQNPLYLDYDVVTSKDSEGNGYNEIYYTPSVGQYDEGDFIDEDYYDGEDEEVELNAVCVN